jgi:hypothetical protein
MNLPMDRTLDGTWREQHPVMSQLKQKLSMWLFQDKSAGKARTAPKKRRVDHSGLNDLLSGSYSCESMSATRITHSK